MLRPTLVLACLAAVPAAAQTPPATAVPTVDAVLNLMSWGGDFSESQAAAYARPFTTETGIRVNIQDSEDPPTVVKTQAEAGNVTLDLASVGQADAERFCDEGIVEPIDPATLAPGADGTPPAQDFLPGALSECFVGTDVYSAVIAYDAQRAGAQAPRTAADFFDLERFPGRRGLGRTPEFTLELALLGDGVPAAQVYAVLATPEGVERALRKLDSIRDQIVWWETGAQAVQLLADGEVAMTHVYNGRVFKAAVADHKPLAILWDGQIYEMEGWVIPKGAPNAAAARQFVSYSTTPGALARAASELPYGPPRRSSAALVSAYAHDASVQMAPHLPTTPANMGNALAMNPQFWADNESQLKERFAAWLAR